MHDRCRLAAGHAQVVAVEGDVQVAEGDGAVVVGVAQLGEQAMQAPGQVRAAAVDAHQRQRAGRVGFQDLVSDARERAPHVIAVEDDPLVLHRAPSGLSGPG